MKLNKFEMIFRLNIAVTCKSNLSGETRPISPGTPKHPELWRGCITAEHLGLRPGLKVCSENMIDWQCLSLGYPEQNNFLPKSKS